MAKTGLGRGLSSLLGARPSADKKTKAGKTPATADSPNEVPIGAILPGAMQPRNGFDDDSLNELAESIRENGIVQPEDVDKVKKRFAELVDWSLLGNKISIDNSGALVDTMALIRGACLLTNSISSRFRACSLILR